MKQGSNKDGRGQDKDHRTVGEESQETSNHRDPYKVDGVEFVFRGFFSFRSQTDFPFLALPRCTLLLVSATGTVERRRDGVVVV